MKKKSVKEKDIPIVASWEQFAESKVGKACFSPPKDSEKDSLLRRMQVKAAFLSGWKAGAHTLSREILEEVKKDSQKVSRKAKKASKTGRKEDVV